MLKGFVSGEEKDIVRIPMKGKNLSEFDATTYLNDNAYYVSNRILDSIPAGSYTLSYFVDVDPSVGSFAASVGVGSTIASYEKDIKTVNNIVSGYVNIPFSITDADAGKKLFVRFVRSGSRFTATVTVTKVMLNIGSQALPYEPYGYQEGWEVRDNQDRLIWGREDELQTATDTLPFKGYGLPVKVKSLLGNAVQNGTPAPDNIVVPEMCGVRTGNLWNEDYTGISGGLKYVPVYVGDGSFTLSTDTPDYSRNAPLFLLSGNVTSGASTPVNGVYNGVSRTAASSNGYITIAFRRQSESSSPITHNTMLNLGSTALPYEPYGWKVPFENHGENLFNIDGKNTENGYTDNTELMGDGTTKYWANGETSEYITVSSNAQYTLTNMGSYNAPGYCFYTENKEYISGSGFNGRSVITFTTPSNCKYVRFTHVKTQPKTMLNLGSTPKPYSPYLNETIPVYLGEVPTVRRVKKYEFTGTEALQTSGSGNARFFYMTIADARSWATIISDRYVNANVQSTTEEIGVAMSGNSQFRIRPDTTSTVEEYKQYLASEYAAGTPVTVWYVLANEQTGIVNEPLAKISTYADELTTIQVHGLSAPLYGIGDYKDTLNLSTGVVTRKVKKLVLDGTEGWYKNGNTYLIRLRTIKSLSPSIGLISTHYPPEGTVANVRQYTSTYWSSTPTPVIGIRDESYTSTADFKAFLAAQYQAGTPVIVWYVLSEPETETVTVPTGMTGEIEGYLTQVSTPTPTNRSVPKWNGVEETGGTYAVTVYTPPEIPTTTGENTLTVDTTLAPSSLTVKGHIKELT